MKNQTCSLWTSHESKCPVGSHGKFLGVGDQFLEIKKTQHFCPEPGPHPCEPGRWTRVLWVQVTCWVPRQVPRCRFSILRNKNKTIFFYRSQDLFPVNLIGGPRSCQLWKPPVSPSRFKYPVCSQGKFLGLSGQFWGDSLKKFVWT